VPQVFRRGLLKIIAFKEGRFMAMPHPRVLMIPFGAVVLVSKTGAHATVDIYSTKKAIEKLHPALASLGTVITKNDDLPSSGIYKSIGPPAVIAKKTIKVNKNHKAYMVPKAVKMASKKLVPAGDFSKPMKHGWYYWLEPA
jgi:hypothetical protein